MTAHHEAAFAKVNLCLFLGGTRSDGRHELVTLFESVGLSDDLLVTPADSDHVLCAGVEGPNLVGDALAALRACGWAAPPVAVEIHKRIPVAAGMGGGSADAAALLRVASRLAPVPASLVSEIAANLGADVPGQLDPGPSIGTGAGEVIERVPGVGNHAVLVVPQPFGLSTADVYREADHLGLGRPARELESLRSGLGAAVVGGQPLPEAMIVNDLQVAAVSLAPQVESALTVARELGAEQTIVCGSGPTVIGLFWGSDARGRADAAAERARARFPGAVATEPVARSAGGLRRRAPNE